MSDSPINSQTAEVVIIGGGVIGLAIARALRLRGLPGVTLLERGQPGTEASWAAGGIIAPQVEAHRPDDFFQLACQSRDLYPVFANALIAESEVDVELDPTGTLYVGFSAAEEAALRHRYEWQTSAGYAVEWLSADEARSREQCISANVRCALRFPNDIQVENRKLITALTIACVRLGVKVLTGCEARTLRIERGKIRGVQTSLGWISSPTVIMAAGSWSSSIDSSIDSAGPTKIRIEPIRGQMLCFKSHPPIARHVIYSSGGYLVPRRDGRLLAGSTAEQVGFDKSVTEDGIKAIKAMAFQIAPSLANLPIVDSWAGFRPRAPDDLPVIGPADDVGGLIYATGHYRNGILLAPVTAELIADLIVNGEISPLLTPCLPHRFRESVNQTSM